MENRFLVPGTIKQGYLTKSPPLDKNTAVFKVRAASTARTIPPALLTLATAYTEGLVAPNTCRDNIVYTKHTHALATAYH